MRITWLGHACFLLKSLGGSVVIDPYSDPEGTIRLPPLHVTADAAVYSHDHFDHCCPAAVKLTGRPCPLHIQALPTFHDKERGARLGPNLVHIISDGAVRVAHLGDLGHELSADQLAELGAVDVLLVNVGGYGHHSATPLALQLVKSIRPRVVIPMHYRLDCFGPESSDTANAFLARQRAVEYADQNSILIGPGELPRTVVLRYFPQKSDNSLCTDF